MVRRRNLLRLYDEIEFEIEFEIEIEIKIKIEIEKIEIENFFFRIVTDKFYSRFFSTKRKLKNVQLGRVFASRSSRFL